MKKVYCKNCKYFWAYRERTRCRDYVYTDYYCDPKETIKYDGSGIIVRISDMNKKNLIKINKPDEKRECKYYKRKWWKFWIKQEKRKILKGAQPKTEAGPKPEIIPSISIEKYLDNAIKKWRNELGISKTKEDKLIAKCYIDAYQSVRISILGKLLPKENK